MQILRVITRMNGGGPARQVAYLQKVFNQNGYGSRLIHGQLDHNEKDFSSLLEDSRNSKHSFCLRRPISPLFDVLACLEIWWELMIAPYEVMHTHTAKAGLCGRLAAWFYQPFRVLMRRPRLMVVHTYHGHVFSGYFQKNLESKVKKIEAWLWKKTDVVVALTEKLKKEIVEHLQVDENRMKVVPLGLDLAPYLQVQSSDFFNQCFEQNRKTWVGWVGRMEPIKNPMRFIEIAQKLCEENSELGFVLIGDGSLRNKLQSVLKAKNLENRIFMMGWSDDLLNIYAGLDLMVNTSDNEGTPVAVLEALSAGVRVVATDVGGVAELLTPIKAAKVFDPNNSDGVSSVEEMLEEGQILCESERKSVVEKFSQKKLCDNLVKCYQHRTKEQYLI